jgi:hypothetical protein
VSRYFGAHEVSIQNITISYIKARETRITYASEIFRPCHAYLHLRRVWLFKFAFDRMSHKATWWFDLAIDLRVKPGSMSEAWWKHMAI